MVTKRKLEVVTSPRMLPLLVRIKREVTEW